mgnify:FL=1
MEFKKGYFITFEGADGCGKTTQIELLDKFLKEKGLKTLMTLEPGASDLGKDLRQILLHYEKPVSDEAEMFMYLADRAQHAQMIIKPALEDKKIVLCDRYTDSTVAYQGYGREGDIEQINILNKIATKGLKSDLTILFDVESEIAQSRLGKTKDRLESQGMEFHKKVRKGYLELAKQDPKRIKVVDANRTIDEVWQDVKKIVEELLGL